MNMYINLSSSAQGPGHIWPGFFECLQLNNFLSKNNVRKIAFPEVFSLPVLLQDIPPTMMRFWLIIKKYQKSKSPGHMRPGPWKSCHSREE